MNLEHKNLNIYVTNFETKQSPTDGTIGIVESYISTFGGQPDYVDDVIMSSAFDQTIREDAQNLKVLDNHQDRSVLDSVGKNILIEAVKDRSKLPQQILDIDPTATGGLRTITQFYLDDEKSKGVFFRLKTRMISHFSIGYSVIKSHIGMVKGRQVRYLDQLRLFEYSAVLYPANNRAILVDAKSNQLKRTAGLLEVEKILNVLDRTARLSKVDRRKRLRELEILEVDLVLDQLDNTMGK